MITAEDVEKAVEQLTPRELARFRAWFEAFDARQFDAAIERISPRMARMVEQHDAAHVTGELRRIGKAQQKRHDGRRARQSPGSAPDH